MYMRSKILIKSLTKSDKIWLVYLKIYVTYPNHDIKKKLLKIFGPI